MHTLTHTRTTQQYKAHIEASPTTGRRLESFMRLTMINFKWKPLAALPNQRWTINNQSVN